MEVYQTNAEGFYIGSTFADPDPLDKGNWLIPAGCVTEAPPNMTDNQVAQWVAGSWVVVDIPKPVEPEPVEPEPVTKEKQAAIRRDAYAQEADPIFFMVQRGEATMDEWLAKIAEIKARYPYPEETA